MLTSLQALLRLASLRWLGVFVCALATLLPVAGTASALEPAQTKTRVWGFDFAERNSVGLFRAATPRTHPEISSARCEVASGSLLAAEGAGALRFSQTTASPLFSAEGTFAGKSIGSLAGELRAGTAAASQVPVGVVNIGGNTLIVNTRSALALTRAGIPQGSWSLIDMTATNGAAIEARLLSNGLTAEGTATLRITGLGQSASALW